MHEISCSERRERNKMHENRRDKNGRDGRRKCKRTRMGGGLPMSSISHIPFVAFCVSLCPVADK
jgi:hypothetical protein